MRRERERSLQGERREERRRKGNERGKKILEEKSCRLPPPFLVESVS